MNDQKPNPSAGGRYVLGDDSAHVPVDQAPVEQVAKGSAEADETSSVPAARKTIKTNEVKDVTAK